MTSAANRWSGRIAGISGLALYLLVGVFPYAASGLVAPLWGIVFLYAGWLVGLVVAIRLYRRRSPWTVILAPLALGFWWAVITLGDALLGWTA